MISEADFLKASLDGFDHIVFIRIPCMFASSCVGMIVCFPHGYSLLLITFRLICFCDRILGTLFLRRYPSNRSLFYRIFCKRNHFFEKIVLAINTYHLATSSVWIYSSPFHYRIAAIPRQSKESCKRLLLFPSLPLSRFSWDK